MNSMYRIPNRIFVGGIPQSASQDELRDYFSHFGHVKDARIISDQRGNSRGYGFVTYDNENDATKVLSLKEEELMFKENRLNIGHAFRKKNFNNNGTGNPNGAGHHHNGALGGAGGGYMNHNGGQMMGGAGGHGMGGGQHHHHHGGSHHGGAGTGAGLHHQMNMNHQSAPSYLDPQMTNMHPMVGGQGYAQANGLNLPGINGHLGMSAGGLNGHLGHMGAINGMNSLSNL